MPWQTGLPTPAWYEFGDEAFAKAKELDRPVLLDIGAVWCHWCHVIDRESYEDSEIAQLINEHYIAVKVDRDQRPDIDARYQQVISSLSGQGGWPLTGFLTYDGRVIYGGTYFPPQTMKSLLLRIREIYEEKKTDIFQSGDMLTDELVHQAEGTKSTPLNEPKEPLAKSFYESIIHTIRNGFDSAYGGFGTQPKFPHFSALQLLITHTFQSQDTFYRQIVEKTLDEMARGGIYDQIAGGFHRYSVDREWHVPHFEKMAYDNAEALTVYAQGYRLTNNPLFREVTEGIIGWVDAQLSDQTEGGFYASQDADIDLEDDGDHFTWTVEEVRAILSPDEAEVTLRYYDIHPQGDMHERPGRNVLWVRSSLQQVANQLELSQEKAQALLASAKVKMLAQRAQRPIPFIDNTVYVNWNGMMITGYLEAADLLNLPKARAFALKTMDRLIQQFYRPGEQVLHCEGVEGFLEDYTQFAQAALRAYQASGIAQYRHVCEDVTQLALKHFYDEQSGGFYDIRQTPGAHGLLKFQRKPVEDNPSSSPNAVLLQVLHQLYFMTGNAQYHDVAEKTLRNFGPEYQHYGMFVGALGLAAYQFLHPPLKIELVGQSQELMDKARVFFYPGKILTYTAQEQSLTPEARLCVGQQCFAPVKEGSELTPVIQAALTR
jgi:uncharacterized protein